LIESASAGVCKHADIDAQGHVLYAQTNPAFGGVRVPGECAGGFTCCPDLYDGVLHSVDDARVVHLAGNAERLGEIVRAEENDVDVWHGDDIIEVLESSDALDMDDDELFLVELVMPASPLTV